jgi:protein-S-isoprenylcysteine O-methyltransferase Ste14
VVLAAVVLLWQTSPTTLLALPGSLRWLPRAFSALAVLAFIWGVRALRVFDPFGRMVLLAHLRGRRLPTLPLVVRGPYLWVRHPLYSCMLVLIWSVPEISLDRFVFNALWTAWIVLGTIWEERDLVVEFGDRYRHYQQTVPMLLPWRGSAGRQQSDS